MNPAAELRLARRLIRDLRTPSSRRYWLDLCIASLLLWGGWSLTLVGARAPRFVGFVIAVLALNRAALFVHEISHRKKGQMDGFRWFWNLVVGIPLGVPAFLYERPHQAHHRLHVYRTHDDPDHPPELVSTPVRWLRSIASAVALPVLLWVRWSFVAPISLVHPALRSWTQQRFSSLTINPRYRPSRHRWVYAIEESLTATWFVLLTCAVLAGSVSLELPLSMAFVLSTVVAISDLRGHWLHDFEPNPELGTRARQVRDSVNFEARGLLRLIFPLGIGLHALHHLDPALPYHNMERAHARLQASLPPNGLYQSTVRGLSAQRSTMWTAAALH